MNIKPEWISGFTDGEGCFHVALNRNKSMRLGIQVLPEFTITQHKRDLKVLYGLQTYWKCGVVRPNHGDRFCYRVRNIKHLQEIIIPFFKQHHLITKKRRDFEVFCKCILVIKSKQHLTLEGLSIIRNYTEQMNTKATPQVE